jgi:eukaryotic-like serine/threonine-protein kinase
VAAKPSWEFEEGTEIVPGRHAVRLLGGGRLYEAYAAWDDDLYSLVALKILRPPLAADDHARATIASEARMLSRVSHPVVVRSFGAELDGGRPHLVLEFLDGPRLSTLLRRYGVALEQALTLALELCSALHYLSTQDVVHLDVKPRNIIMTGPPRLVDLSVAKHLSELADVARPIGTDAYMAPEQCDPGLFSEIGHPSDVWGLGVTMYEALARRLPFPPAADGEAARERFPQLTSDPAPLPPSTPAGVAALVGSCLERRPGDRPTASELADALQPVVAGLPTPRLGLFRPGGRLRRSDFQLG